MPTRSCIGCTKGTAVAAIEAAFPGTTAAGKVDRTRLAARVLGDDAALERLEAIVHPLVQRSRTAASSPRPRRAATRSRCSIFRSCSRPGAIARVDAVVVVSAPPEVQRSRVLERPGMTPEKLEAILAKQMPDPEKRRRADFVVDTSQGFEAARAQVRAILDAVATMPKRRR